MRFRRIAAVTVEERRVPWRPRSSATGIDAAFAELVVRGQRTLCPAIRVADAGLHRVPVVACRVPEMEDVSEVVRSDSPQVEGARTVLHVDVEMPRLRAVEVNDRVIRGDVRICSTCAVIGIPHRKDSGAHPLKVVALPCDVVPDKRAVDHGVVRGTRERRAEIPLREPRRMIGTGGMCLGDRSADASGQDQAKSTATAKRERITSPPLS